MLRFADVVRDAKQAKHRSREFKKKSLAPLFRVSAIIHISSYPSRDFYNFFRVFSKFCPSTAQRATERRERAIEI